MKKERDQALSGRSLALGKLHKSIIGTDVEGKIDYYFTAPFSLEYLHPHWNDSPLECFALEWFNPRI